MGAGERVGGASYRGARRASAGSRQQARAPQRLLGQLSACTARLGAVTHRLVAHGGLARARRHKHNLHREPQPVGQPAQLARKPNPSGPQAAAARQVGLAGGHKDEEPGRRGRGGERRRCPAHAS
jgi:hypothetical protein